MEKGAVTKGIDVLRQLGEPEVIDERIDLEILGIALRRAGKIPTVESALEIGEVTRQPLLLRIGQFAFVWFHVKEMQAALRDEADAVVGRARGSASASA